MTEQVRVISPLCRIRYPQIFSPKVETKADLATGQQVTTQKYGGQLVFDTSVQTELQQLQQQVYELGVKEFGENFWAMVQQRTIRWPFRDGAEINPKTGQPRYAAGITYINVNSHSQVEVVSKYCDPADERRRPVRVTDPSQLWAGQYVKASLTFKPYRRNDSWGIGCYVNGVQLWHEGERFPDSFDAQEAFDAEGEMPTGELPAQQPDAAPPAPPQPGPGGFNPGQTQPPTAPPQPGPGGFNPGGSTNLL